MTFKRGHVFLVWTQKQIFYTKAETQCLHSHVLHPSVAKLFQSFRRAQPAEATGELYRTKKSISQYCGSCRSYSRDPFSFRATIGPEQFVFNLEMAIDLMWVAGNQVLHVVSTRTNFPNATVLRIKRTEDIWVAFVECWESVYVGYPRVARLDQEASFKTAVLDDLGTANGIELRFSGTESKKPDRPGEVYHAPLRRFFRVIRERYPRIEPKVVVRY